MEIADVDYDLPEAAIAQVPMEPRDQARLLVDGGPGHPPRHRVVADLPEHLQAGDVVVVNTTRVLPARLRLRKPTGGAVEVLLLERTDAGGWDALVRPSRRVAEGAKLAAGDDLVVEVGGPGADDGTRRVRLHVPDGADELDVLARHGRIPLPPYITAPLGDPERYQTVYADRAESVAAPTAGLHLTPVVLERCRAAGATVVPVELVVGLGTFRPIQAERVEDHHMHAERYRVPDTTAKVCRQAHERGHRVVAVGTTAVRALESAAATGRPEGRTELFIRRPFDWKVVDVLLTNFHLPRSSLLVLLDAFVGPRWHDLYREALAEGYRFLSFGDAMLVERAPALAVPAPAPPASARPAESGDR
jgi:S-adenosylmethionine:tRNA ribosyltransferase-isomerase